MGCGRPGRRYHPLLLVLVGCSLSQRSLSDAGGDERWSTSPGCGEVGNKR